MDIVTDLLEATGKVPEPVNDELQKMQYSYNYNYVYNDLQAEILRGAFDVARIEVDTPEEETYLRIISGRAGKRVGKGEAASIVLAKSFDGTLASNNLQDILPHIVNGVPPYVCTDEIMFLSLKKGYITLSQGNRIWIDMKGKNRKLPAYDFTESVRRFENGLPR